MADLNVNSIGDASGGNTATINSYTPTESNMAGRNLIINGAMQVAQRGTSFSHNGQVFAWGADRFQSQWYTSSFGTPTGGTTAQVDLTDSVSSGLQFTKAIRLTPHTDSEKVYFSQKVEDVKLLSGKTLTFSFYARTGAGSFNLFPGGTMRVLQSFGSGGSTSVSNELTASATVTTSWQRFEITYTIPSVAGKTIGAGNFTQFYILNADDLTSLNGSWIEVTGVQLEAGSVATPFEHRSYGQELALCQRYFQKYTSALQGSWGTTTVTYQTYLYPVVMRTAPTWNYSNIFYSSASGLGTNSSTAALLRTTLTITAGGGYGYAAFDMETSGAEL